MEGFVQRDTVHLASPQLPELQFCSFQIQSSLPERVTSVPASAQALAVGVSSVPAASHVPPELQAHLCALGLHQDNLDCQILGISAGCSCVWVGESKGSDTDWFSL